MQIRQLEERVIHLHDVKSHLKSLVYTRSDEAFDKGDKSRDCIRTIEQLETRNTWMRQKFIESMGGLPSSDSPLHAKVVGIIACDGYSIEKIIFESRPRVYVTSNLYVPDGIATPRGTVLFLCGHHMKAKHEDEYQIVCQYLVRAGLIVLAMDPIGQGERFSYYEQSINASTERWGTHEHDYAGTQCWPLGDSIARYFTHDGMRAIDYLCTRPEVDPKKIGVTGNSGGGTQTSLLMMCEPRIAAAVPVTFLMNRQTYMYANQAQDAEQIWTGMTALGFDHEDILMMMSPRPVLVLAVTYDFFPIEGTRRTVSRSKRFWEMYGNVESIDFHETDSEHYYTRSMAKKAAEFFSKQLLGQRVSPADDGIEPIPPSLLWCTQIGQVRGELAGARAVYEENADRLNGIELLRDAASETERMNKAIVWQREKVFADRKRYEQNPRHAAMGLTDQFVVESSLWWAQEGVFNHAYTFTDHQFIGSALPVTIAVWDGGTSRIQPHLSWIRETCSSGRAVVILDVSGVGPLMPYTFSDHDPLDFYAVIQKLTHDLMWLNDSMAALRVYDVIRAVDMVESWAKLKKEGLQLYASGRQGMYARIAALLDPRVTHIEAVNGMNSIAEWVRARHYDSYDITGIVIPGMLKYFDLPDLERWKKC